ncbi:MAG: type II toxin-antitoxin system VapC family toxin [Pirellulales bacterium]
MKLVDLNVLLYAVNRESAHHDAVRTWWEGALTSDEPVGLAWVVLLGFLRLATNPRVFVQPLSIDAAAERINAWLGHENVRVVGETEDHWTVLRWLLRESGTAGNLTTDAHLAALAITHGAVLGSCDADFGRFRGLRWENPLGS